MSTFDLRGTVLLVVPERGQASPDRGPLANRFQKPEGDLVFRLDPGTRRRSVGVFQRAIRIGHLDPMIALDGTGSRRLGIMKHRRGILPSRIPRAHGPKNNEGSPEKPFDDHSFSISFHVMSRP